MIVLVAGLAALGLIVELYGVAHVVGVVPRDAVALVEVVVLLVIAVALEQHQEDQNEGDADDAAEDDADDGAGRQRLVARWTCTQFKQAISAFQAKNLRGKLNESSVERRSITCIFHSGLWR